MQHFLFQPDEAAIQAVPLPANQARALIAAHRAALRETARIELDPTFPARFVQTFADSPNLTAPDETLPELIALFDAIRARMPESIPTKPFSKPCTAPSTPAAMAASNCSPTA